MHNTYVNSIKYGFELQPWRMLLSLRFILGVNLSVFVYFFLKKHKTVTYIYTCKYNYIQVSEILMLMENVDDVKSNFLCINEIKYYSTITTNQLWLITSKEILQKSSLSSRDCN